MTTQTALGDCGSWVVDPDNGQLYGNLVARCPSLIQTYFLPAGDVLASISASFDGADIQLSFDITVVTSAPTLLDARAELLTSSSGLPVLNEAWTFTKAAPLHAGDSASWTRVTRVKTETSRGSLRKAIQRQRRARGAITCQYQDLSRNQRGQIDMLLFDKNSEEPYYEWTYVYVDKIEKDVHRKLRVIGYETASITIVIEGTPRTQSASQGKKSVNQSHSSKKIVDLSQPSTSFDQGNPARIKDGPPFVAKTTSETDEKLPLRRLSNVLLERVDVRKGQSTNTSSISEGTAPLPLNFFSEHHKADGSDDEAVLVSSLPHRGSLGAKAMDTRNRHQNVATDPFIEVPGLSVARETAPQTLHGHETTEAMEAAYETQQQEILATDSLRYGQALEFVGPHDGLKDDAARSRLVSENISISFRPNSTWLSRDLVSPRACEAAHEKFDERSGYIHIPRVLRMDEIESLANETQRIRGARHERAALDKVSERDRRAIPHVSLVHYLDDDDVEDDYNRVSTSKPFVAPKIPKASPYNLTPELEMMLSRPRYTAKISNLGADIESPEVKAFFIDCQLKRVTLFPDGLGKYFGSVEFATRTGLNRALALDGENLGGRAISVTLD